MAERQGEVGPQADGRFNSLFEMQFLIIFCELFPLLFLVSILYLRCKKR